MIKNYKGFVNEMYYDNWEIVPKEFCKGLKSGDLFRFDYKDFMYVIGEILYPKNGNPEENGCVEYWPEITPVAHPSMFKLHAIDKIEDVDNYKVITLKKDNE